MSESFLVVYKNKELPLKYGSILEVFEYESRTHYKVFRVFKQGHNYNPLRHNDPWGFDTHEHDPEYYPTISMANVEKLTYTPEGFRPQDVITEREDRDYFRRLGIRV
jgi:hypothetical protein